MLIHHHDCGNSRGAPLSGIKLALVRLIGGELDPHGFRPKYLARVRERVEGQSTRFFLNLVDMDVLSEPGVSLYLIVAQRDEGHCQVVAGVYARPQDSLGDVDSLVSELCGLVTAEGWGGFGLGRALVNAAIQDLRMRQPLVELRAVVRVMPETTGQKRDLNKASAALFAECGFAPSRILRVLPLPEQEHLAASTEDGYIHVIEFASAVRDRRAA